MYDAIRSFPDHIAHGVQLGREGGKIPASRARRIVVLGMGGSAIGGDLLRSFAQSYPESQVSIVISRGYEPPRCDRSTLVIASSYSGETEETLTALERVEGSAGAILVVTTGGRLGEVARTRGYRSILLPKGLQPRAALAYSFVPLAWQLGVTSGLFGASVREAIENGVVESESLTRRLGARYGRNSDSGNRARAIAARLAGSVPVIYSASDRLDVVNLRWRGQIQENAKQVAFGNLLPEMNHNEINGYGLPGDLMNRFVPVFLRDREDHPRVAARIDATKSILNRLTGGSVVVESTGETRLARIFSLIHLGDWVSYWMALRNGVDPMPVPVIEGLKRRLSRA